LKYLIITNIILLVMDKKYNILEKPTIKNIDTRCSFKCIQNWTRYNQKPPIGHYCHCIIKNK
jgi:hypothetical protein